MYLKEISFEPMAEVEFSACDVNLLMEWSRKHYDSVCQDASKHGHFLYGLSNSAPDYRILNNDGIKWTPRTTSTGDKP